MELKDLLQVVNYQFNTGGKYQWHCYGDDAFFIDFKTVSGKHTGGAVINTAGQVFEAYVEVTDEPVCYRMVNPDHYQDLLNEAKSRNVDPAIAWDDVRYTDLELDQDFLEKFEAIVNERPFDRGILVPINLSEADQLILFRQAHEAGMTFNDFMVQILTKEVERQTAAKAKEEEPIKKKKRKAKK